MPIANVVAPSSPVIVKEAGTVIPAPAVKEEPQALEPLQPVPEIQPVEPVIAPSDMSTAPTVVPPPAPTGSHEDWMAQAGISVSDYSYVDYIINHESGWRSLVSNASSGAYGLCQALPGSKMATAGEDWASNPITQLRWCSSYATGRYGSWSGAYNVWLNQHWW